MRPLATLGIILTLGLLLAAQAVNQRPPTRVEFANVVRIFNQLRETQDLRTVMATQARDLDAQRIQKSNRVREIQQQRETLAADDPKRAELQSQLRSATAELDVWIKLAQEDIKQDQKQKIKRIYDQITATIGEVAKERGTQLVLAQQSPEVPDMTSITIEQLRQMLNERDVLYGEPSVDLSDAVVAAMNARYQPPQL